MIYYNFQSFKSSLQCIIVTRHSQDDYSCDIKPLTGFSLHFPGNSGYRWRNKYGGTEVSDARKLRGLEKENAQLKKLVAKLTLDKQMLQHVMSKKW